jgi:Protein kinase domain/PEGA domain
MTAIESTTPGSSPERDPLDAAAREDLRDLFSLESLHRRGPGGGSIVYMARDLEYDQRVAVKVVARRAADGSAAEEAFHKAAAAAAVLDHPHIVQLYSAGATDRLYWWSMRYVEGRSLAERLRSTGPLELSACLRTIGQVAAALESAHRLGVVHADLTPANVLIDGLGQAHVTDFWVPWVVRHNATPNVARPRPETDQAALSALVEACLGKPWSELPPQVARAIERAMRPSPTEQFPNVLGLGGALDTHPAPHAEGALPLQLLGYEAMGNPPAQAARWRWVSAALVALVAFAVVAAPWLMSSGSRSDRSSYTPAPEAPGTGDTLAVQPAASPAAPPAPAPATTVGPATIVNAAPRDSLATVSPAPPAVPARRAVARAPRPRTPAPVKRAAPRAAEMGRLFVNATPWGQVYLDDQLLGNTPQVGVAVAPGPHRLRVLHDGFEPFELAINVAAGQQLRFTDIVLHEVKP